MTILLIGYLNTNLFQVKRHPVPPLCHPKENYPITLTRHSFFSEKWTVQCVHYVPVWDTRTVKAMPPIPILSARAAPVMVPSELDSFLEGFSITRSKFFSDKAEKVKMLLTFMYKFQMWWFLLFGCENLSYKLKCLSKMGQYIFYLM
jgi:hypothetical protein